jgi:hypothetical protein
VIQCDLPHIVRSKSNSEELDMAKFMSTHTLPPGAMKREQVNQLADAAKNDPVIKPYRSFCNLSEGKIMCVMEAPDKQALADWFKKMNVPCDNISPVELEGERGAVQDA